MPLHCHLWLPTAQPKPPSDLHEFRLIASGTIDVRPLISRIVGLPQLPTALAELDADPNRYHKLLVSPDA